MGKQEREEWTIAICSECRQLLDNDRDFGWGPVDDCPKRCGYFDSKARAYPPQPPEITIRVVEAP